VITIQESKISVGFTLSEAMQTHQELGDLMKTDFIIDKPRLAEIYKLLCERLGFDAK
jgi:hypothetical protein